VGPHLEEVMFLLTGRDDIIRIIPQISFQIAVPLFPARLFKANISENKAIKKRRKK
jgi:hypothetical protein